MSEDGMAAFLLDHPAPAESHPLRAARIPVPAPAPAPVAAPDPVPAPAPAPVVEPEPDGTAEEPPKPEPAPAPVAAPPPKPAPAPAASTGTVSVRGNVPVELRGTGGAKKPGAVPPGSYEIWADFGQGMTRASMDMVTVTAGAAISVKCSTLRQACKVQ